ncbi:SusD/RagB family nutrient-binding outer membrane lipoprotein [Fulvivirga sp. M361]|uniref:SusD/RagB family nutrient-binding outer membrane lipoprotein n=1 Tax=Fulvivirga sp. M361 TaxID=2594266 RepID=UPI0016265054|nr:SusD/RagB family nutrient-binding outer membrane lipoprotein [Fulvivirga sp. M361]
MISVIIMTSCEENFLDINTDPNNPADVPINQLLPAAEAGLAFYLGQNTDGWNNACATFVHHVTNFRVDQYNMANNQYDQQWAAFFSGPMRDLQIIINKATESGDMHYVGIAKILKAYGYSIAVDLWDRVPYFEALQGAENFSPNYDDGAAIYTDLLRLLDEAAGNLNEASSLSPSTDDLIYQGNLTRWRKMANTLKLKLYNQVRLVQDNNAAIQALLTANDFLTSAADDFEMPYGTSFSPENRNPGFINNWSNTSRETQISPWFYQIMIDLNDPRIPYYWYNQIAQGGNAQNPTDFQDDTQFGLFVSVRFGSQAPNASFAQQGSFTIPGLYPVGGALNPVPNTTSLVAVGQSPGAGQITGPGNVPQRFLTYYALKFIQAELALEEGIGGNAETIFREAMEAAFAKVNEVAAGASQSTISSTDIEAYVTSRVAEFTAADDAGKLELIITQKWIATFGFSIDAYTDYRRTGFPEIFDPNADTDPATVSTRSFPVSFPYSQSDLAAHINPPSQRVIAQDRVFWDAN